MQMISKKLRLFARRVYSQVAKPAVSRYLRKERIYRYGDIRLRIPPGVFHPGFFHSTKILLEYLHTIDLKNKTLLEPGCGSGLISIRAAKQGAIVTAGDISRTAVEALKENTVANGVSIRIIHSDLFENIPQQRFDWIVINPPFYRGKPQSEADYAWYAGEELEYYSKLMNGIRKFDSDGMNAIIILGEDSPATEISKIAAKEGVEMACILSENVFFEILKVYRLNIRVSAGQVAESDLSISSNKNLSP